jgi:hypothetical protein
MPVSRLLVRPEVDDAPPALSLTGGIGLQPVDEPRPAVETVLGPVGPVRAARWTAQLPASAAAAPASLGATSSPNADATSS